MIGTLLKKEFKANLLILIIFMALLSMYSVIIVAMYDPKLGESMNMLAKSMPEIFSAFGMSNPGTTLLDLITNCLYGFILIAIPFVFTIIMCQRLVARYIDKGSMAYLLATPRSRFSVIITQLIVLLGGLLILVVYVTGLILMSGQIMFDELIPLKELLTLNLGLYALHAFLATMCFLFACSFNETKFSIGIGAGLGLVFILIQMLSQIGDKMDFLKYLTPLTLFDATGLTGFDSMALINIVILFVAAILMAIIACRIFQKRDLPL